MQAGRSAAEAHDVTSSMLVHPREGVDRACCQSMDEYAELLMDLVRRLSIMCASNCAAVHHGPSTSFTGTCVCPQLHPVPPCKAPPDPTLSTPPLPSPPLPPPPPSSRPGLPLQVPGSAGQPGRRPLALPAVQGHGQAGAEGGCWRSRGSQRAQGLAGRKQQRPLLVLSRVSFTKWVEGTCNGMNSRRVYFVIVNESERTCQASWRELHNEWWKVSTGNIVASGKGDERVFMGNPKHHRSLMSSVHSTDCQQ